MKLEIFGDSILKGVIYKDKKYLLSEDNKYNLLNNKGITVNNFSRMGATIEKGNSIINRKIENIEQGSTILLEFGGNDCNYNWKEISDNPEIDIEPFTAPDKFINDYKNIIKNLKSKGFKVVVSNLIPISAKKYMNFITKGLNYNNILKWLGDIEHLYRWQEYYNTLVEKIAKDENCEILDLRSSFLKHNFENLICDDGIHPTQNGHNLIANSLLEFAAAEA